jgi:hypothetical protein
VENIALQGLSEPTPKRAFHLTQAGAELEARQVSQMAHIDRTSSSESYLAVLPMSEATMGLVIVHGRFQGYGVLYGQLCFVGEGE